jgi:hypothetical protein
VSENILERNELSSNSTNSNILRNFSIYNILLKKLPTKSKNPFKDYLYSHFIKKKNSKYALQCDNIK